MAEATLEKRAEHREIDVVVIDKEDAKRMGRWQRAKQVVNRWRRERQRWMLCWRQKT